MRKKNIFVSSASIIGSIIFEAFGRSLTCIRNNKGPKIEPCGTPYGILSKAVRLLQL